MNPLFYVLIGLKGVSSTISIVEGFISNTSVKKVLDEVNGAIQTAITILSAVSAKVNEGVKAGDINPSDPELGGIDAEDHKAKA